MNTNNDRLRVALVGPGRIATAHLEAIAACPDVATLEAVVGLPHEHERTKELASTYGAAAAIDDVAEVLNSDHIDAAVLTVPNHVHAPMVIDMLESGKHVLVEKPLTNSVQDADAMIEAAERNQRTLMVGQCRRFFQATKMARARTRRLGRPLSIVHFLGVFAKQAETGWWQSAADTGGLALGLNGPHVVDTALWLVEATPTRVYATTRRLRDLWEGEDEATLVIDFDDGSVVTGVLSLNTRGPSNERWINGPEGSLRLTDDRNLWADGVPVIQEELTPYITGDVSFERQFREFVASIREQRPPISSGAEGRVVVAVLEAAHRSQQSGQPVDLTDLLLPPAGEEPQM